MNHAQPPENRELLDALESLSSQRSLTVVQQTRRNVMETAQRMQAERAKSRRLLGLVLLCGAMLLVLTTPLLWSFSEAAFSGDEMTDISLFTLMLFVLLLSGLLGVLLSRGSNRRAG